MELNNTRERIVVFLLQQWLR